MNLPNTLSGLIDIALEDLEKVEKMESYVVNMGDWHFPSGNKCEVCAAGAVMAMRLGANWNDDLVPSNFDQDAAKKLDAIDDLRTGWVSRAGRILLKEDTSRFDRNIEPYDIDRDQFFADMRQLSADLKEAGL